MADNLTDKQMVERVLSFYANKKTYEPEMGTIKIWQDKGQMARLALAALQERVPEPLWLTEELAALQGYTFNELESGKFVIKHTSRSGLNAKYSGNDFNFTFFKEYSEFNPFETKYIALLALAKHFERVNKKSKIINAEVKDA